MSNLAISFKNVFITIALILLGLFLFGVSASAGTQTSVQTSYRNGVYSGNYSSNKDGHMSFKCNMDGHQAHKIMDEHYKAYRMRWFGNHHYLFANPFNYYLNSHDCVVHHF